ncbi:chaperonin 10-like protein [Dipodascopsis uninucleata]
MLIWSSFQANKSGDVPDSISNQSFVLQKVNEFSFEDREAPSITDANDVIVQIKTTGVCGSDVHFYSEGYIGDYVVEKPIILGHESAGIVTEVGSAVSNVKVGDTVCVECSLPCYTCSQCLSGQYNHCPGMKFGATPPVDGTLTKFYKLPDTFCYKLPENLSLDEGALIEPLSVAVHSVKQASGITHGSSVVVFGAGPVGLLTAAVAKYACCASEVVLVDVNEQRLKFASEEFKISTYLSPKGYTPADAAADLVARYGQAGERGFEFAIDASGAKYCAQTAIYSLRPRGTFVQTGMGSDTVELPIALICIREINVKGCFRYNKGDFERAIDLASRGIIPVKKLITAKVSFSQAKEAFDSVRRGRGIKTLISGPE